MLLTDFPCSYAWSRRYEYSMSSKHFWRDDIGSLKYTGRQTLVRSFPTLSLIIDQRLTPFSFSAGWGSFFLLLISVYPELDRFDAEQTLGSLKYSSVSWKEGSSSSDTSSNSCLPSDDAVVLHSRNQIMLGKRITEYLDGRFFIK